MKTIYHVENMKCSGCENNIKTMLANVDGITSVETNLEQKTVSIDANKEFDVKDLNAVLKEKNYILSK